MSLLQNGGMKKWKKNILLNIQCDPTKERKFHQDYQLPIKKEVLVTQQNVHTNMWMKIVKIENFLKTT